MKKLSMWSVVLVCASGAGCFENDDQGLLRPAEPVAAEEQGPSHAELYGCEELAFGDVMPLSGPGLGPEGELVGEVQEQYVVAATSVYWKEDKTDLFYEWGAKVMQQLATTEGLVGYALGTDEVCRVGRSISIWRSEEALYSFVFSGAHMQAIDEIEVLSWTGKQRNWMMTAEEIASVDWDLQREKLAAVEPSDVYDSPP